MWEKDENHQIVVYKLWLHTCDTRNVRYWPHSFRLAVLAHRFGEFLAL